MSRIEFMSELRALLADLSEEERDEALQYYNDYFDDAGAENETSIIKELGSPQKLAATIKAGLLGQNEEESEYRETGYTDTRFEQKDSPANRQESSSGYSYSGGYQGAGSNKGLKIALIILIILFGVPVAIPVVLAIVGVVLAVIVAVASAIFAILVSGLALAFAGVMVFGMGFTQLFHSVPVALGLIGAGLILAAIGAALTILMGWITVKIVPPMFRWFVELCRKPFQKRKVNEE